MSERIKTGAYFYPNEPTCPYRVARAGGVPVPSEPVIARTAKSLFPGHDQPRSYSLGKELLDWNDADAYTVRRHIELAQEAGLHFFIIDSYIGLRNGKKVVESGGVFSNLRDMQASELGGLSFAIMNCFRAPRSTMSVLPGDMEKARDFDLTLDTARFIIDHSAQNYWNNSSYMHINGKPYLSFFTPGTGATTDKIETFKAFFQELKDYGLRKYKIEPYVAAVVSYRSPVRDAKILSELGIDAIAGYSNLVRFPQQEAVLDHSHLIDDVVNDWKDICKLTKVAVQPSVVVGVDTTPRCVYIDSTGNQFTPSSVDELKPFVGIHPHTLIVKNSTPDTFARMLDGVSSVVRNSSTPREERLIIINAWNELSEGSTMLPRVREGEVDISYIKQMRSYAKY